MELTSDIPLKGDAWDRALKELGTIFSTRTNYSLFLLSCSIGIMYDQRIEKPEEKTTTEEHSVPRNVIHNNDNGKLDLMLQAAILSTTTVDFTEDERLEIAFGDSTDFNKRDFLVQFANYGVTKLVEQIGVTELETMENIKNFLCTSVEGRNFDIDSLPDEILLMDE